MRRLYIAPQLARDSALLVPIMDGGSFVFGAGHLEILAVRILSDAGSVNQMMA
jgi:hypothetical protein